MMPPPAARDDLMARYDEDAWRTLDAGAAAEAQGDAEGALQLHLAGPHVPGSLREHMLSEVALLAGDAPAWLHARWIAKQAYRWLLLSDDARPREALQMTVDALYADVDGQGGERDEHEAAHQREDDRHHAAFVAPPLTQAAHLS